MHSACLSVEGECYTWGSSQYGQLGHGLAVVKEKTCNVPRRVMVPLGLQQLPQEQEQEQEGQQKAGGGGGDEKLPPPPLPEVPFIAESLSLGGMHTAAVDRDGRLWSWGRADSGQTGQKEWIFTFFSGEIMIKSVITVCFFSSITLLLYLFCLWLYLCPYYYEI